MIIVFMLKKTKQKTGSLTSTVAYVDPMVLSPPTATIINYKKFKNRNQHCYY
jgi:hypothetical protein